MISSKPTVKHLGVHLDSRLRFNWHIAETVRKAKYTRTSLYPMLNHYSSIPVRFQFEPSSTRKNINQNHNQVVQHGEH